MSCTITTRAFLALAFLVPAAARTAAAQETGAGTTRSAPPRHRSAQADLVARRDEKLKAAFLTKAPWILDYGKAREAARSSGRLIFAYFTRSYAYCPPCEALEKGAFSDAAFAEFAKKAVLFCHLTTWVDGDKDQALLTEKGGLGFPHLVIMNQDGEVLATHEDDRSVAAFDDLLAKVGRLEDLRKKAAGGDASAAPEILITELDLGRVSPEDARRRRAALRDVGPDAETRLGAALASREIDVILAGARTREAAVAAGETFATMRKDGRLPAKDRQVTPFWAMILSFAESRKDAALYEEALNALKEKLGDSAPLRRATEILAKLKAAAAESRESRPVR